MSRRGRRAELGLALVGAGTVWATALAWRGFTEAGASYLVPLLGLGLVVAGTGALLRHFAVPGVLVVLGQGLVSALVATAMLTGSPLPWGGTGDDLRRLLELAVETSVSYAAPIPASAPGIHPLLVLGGLGCLLLVDALACTMHRVPLAGLPLLAVYSVPVSVLGTGSSWWVFVLGAAGFLLMLALDAGAAVTRWGRSAVYGPPGSEDDPDGDRSGDAGAAASDEAGFGVRTGAVRAGAGAVGAGATALAILVPLALPTSGLELFGGGNGPGGDGEISVENPMVDLRRDLKRGADFPLVRVRTDDPDPSYLRISVLANFTANEWTSGDRSVPPNQVADGAVPAIEGLSPRVPREAWDYDVEITDDFRSTWLPTQAPVSRVEATGDWRYDAATMDFIAADDDLTTAGARYGFTAVDPELDATLLQEAPPADGEVDDRFLELPADLPPLVRSLAAEQTAGLETDFARAVALQRFFRETGGFRYSLARSQNGNGSDELATFLSTGPQGRVGYCEQFAASMAVMAREIGIPSRVAIGFLEPERLPDGRWEFSARDLHAWPELFFPGAGWTRFEPTPPVRAADAPDYTTQSSDPSQEEPEPDTLPSAAPQDERDLAGQRPEPEQAPAQDDSVDDAGGPAWGRIAGGGGALVAAGALLGLPGLLRRRRRERRLACDVPQCWAELRDTALDLGLSWPQGRSPRETGTALVAQLAGRPGVRADVDLLVEEWEHARFARDPRTSAEQRSAVAAATSRCLEALADRAGPRRARTARWWPPTVVRLRRRRTRSARPMSGRQAATLLTTEPPA